MLLLMSKKRMTLEDLAHMVARGFEEIHGQIKGTATKEDLARVEQKLETRLDNVEVSLDRVENLILTDYRNRLERLEDKVHLLEGDSRL